MTPELWKAIYDFCLIPLILGGLGMIAVMFYRKRYKWAIFFSTVFVLVLLYEAQGKLEDGSTISEQYGMWISQDPVWAIAGLILMVIWMVSLVVHLLAAGMKNKK